MFSFEWTWWCLMAHGKYNIVMMVNSSYSRLASHMNAGAAFIFCLCWHCMMGLYQLIVFVFPFFLSIATVYFCSVIGILSAIFHLSSHALHPRVMVFFSVRIFISLCVYESMSLVCNKCARWHVKKWPRYQSLTKNEQELSLCYLVFFFAAHLFCLSDRTILTVSKKRDWHWK